MGSDITDQTDQPIYKNKAIPQNKIWYYRITYSTYLLVIAFIFQIIKIQNSYEEYNIILDLLPISVGSAIAFGIVPMFVGLFRLFLKKKPTKNIYIFYFAISTLFLFYLLRNEIGKSSNDDFSLRESTASIYEVSKNIRIETYEFNCAKTEYVVTFAKKPKVVDSSVPVNDKFLTSKIAELVIPEFNSFCRAECVQLDASFIGIVDKEYVYSFLNQYSTHNGLSYPNFTYEENEMGKVGSVRGYKSMEDGSGNEIKITFFSRVYFGNRSVMILYVGCPSENYPTPPITKFLNSLRRI